MSTPSCVTDGILHNSSNKCYDARIKSLKPRCTCTGVVLCFYTPPRYGAEHPVDVRFAPPKTERRHKSGAQASRYANLGQGAVCPWHTSCTAQSGRADCASTKYETIHRICFYLIYCHFPRRYRMEKQMPRNSQSMVIATQMPNTPSPRYFPRT